MVERSALEPYQQKLFDFIAQVQPGEANMVKSGTPVMLGMTKAQHQALLAGIKAGTSPKIESNKLFTDLTGISHEALLQRWETEPTFTTCNSFIAQCAAKMGIHDFKTLDGQTGKMQVGQFEIATFLAARGLSRAWIDARSGARPRYGDVFRVDEYHMGVSLEFDDNDTWFTIEGGQGGRTTRGYDIVKRKAEPWGTRTLLGWVDMQKLLGAKAEAPPWLGGWWRIVEDGRNYYYYFDADGYVSCQLNEPLNRLFAPPQTALLGSYSFAKGFRQVEIRWYSSDPDETFTVTGPSRKDGEDEIRGKTFGGKPMTGERMPGPKSTGLNYEEAKKRKAAQDAARAAAGG